MAPVLVVVARVPVSCDAVIGVLLLKDDDLSTRHLLVL